MKIEPVHDKTDEQLRVEVDQLRRHLYDLKSQAVTEKLEDPSQMTKTRRHIARCLTELRERELKQTKTEATQS